MSGLFFKHRTRGALTCQDCSSNMKLEGFNSLKIPKGQSESVNRKWPKEKGRYELHCLISFLFYFMVSSAFLSCSLTS